MRAEVAALLLTSIIHQGWGVGVLRSSSNPVEAFQGSDAIFQWTLPKNVSSRPDFKGLIFGLWKKGYLATYITTVTRNQQVIPNPGLKEEAPLLDGRVHWKGDLAKSLAAFQISAVSTEDQMDYGLILNFGPFKHWPSDSVSLEVKDVSSTITALPFLPIRVLPGKNATFSCEFRVCSTDKSIYEGVAVGVWERGGISVTLMTVTNDERIVVNPKLAQEGPGYVKRVHGHLSTNKTSNESSVVSVELKDVKETDGTSYGCSMHLGPFREPLLASVTLDVKDSYRDLVLHRNPSHTTLEVHAGKGITLSCPALWEVIQLDGTFKYLYWSYCKTSACTTKETKWAWLAGMNSSRATQVTHKGAFADRVNLTRNGSLVLSKVRFADSTEYKCTVQRINFTSPRYYFVTLNVNATEPPKITKRSKSRVTIVKGNTLFLVCEAEGHPIPTVIWRKNGNFVQNGTEDSNVIIHDAGKADAGNYECEASNFAGKVGYRVEVTIIKDSKRSIADNNNEIIVVVCVAVASVIAVAILAIWCYVHKRGRRRQRSVGGNVDDPEEQPITTNT